MGVDWTKLLLAAGGTVAVGGVLYYLLRDEDPAKAEAVAEGGASASRGLRPGGSLSKDQVVQLLDMINVDNQKTKECMKVATKELASQKGEYSFEQAYEKVTKATKREDPLEKAGITPAMFEKVLEEHQNDPEVMHRFMTLMGAGPAGGPPEVPASAKKLGKDKVVEVQAFMVTELAKVLKQLQGVKNKETLDSKSMVLTAQAMVSAKVDEVYQVTTDDLEASVIANMQELQTDQKFYEVSSKFQQMMAGIVQQQ